MSKPKMTDREFYDDYGVVARAEQRHEKVVPNKDAWKREDFLEARRLQIEAAKASQKKNEIIVDHDDSVICDSCSNEIYSDFILTVRYGARAVCDDCYGKWYENEPLQHRILKSDGTLGRILK